MNMIIPKNSFIIDLNDQQTLTLCTLFNATVTISAFAATTNRKFMPKLCTFKVLIAQFFFFI